jgi:hypothetical protein
MTQTYEKCCRTYRTDEPGFRSSYGEEVHKAFYPCMNTGEPIGGRAMYEHEE